MKKVFLILLFFLFVVFGLFSLWQYNLYQRLSETDMSCGGDWSYNVQCPIGSHCRSSGQGPLGGGLCKSILSPLFDVFSESGETSKPKTGASNVPSDFSLEYDLGACHAEWGRSSLKVDNNGNVAVELSQGFFREDKRYSLSRDELANIYKAFLENDFFKLDPEYRNTGIIDGGCSSLKLEADGKSHKVSMINQTPSQMTKITKILLQIMELKDKNWQQVDRKQMCAKAKIACVVTKEFNGIPCEAWDSQCSGQ